MEKYTNGNWEIGINPDKNIGWWEYKGGIRCGELVFTNEMLVDYDGCYELPSKICDLVENAGYVLAEGIRD